jgi:probable rRNA maturation factor
VAYASLDSDIEATLVLTDDAQITTLNRQFRGIDSPTDVLAFPTGETDPDTQTLYLGDVIVSYPRAQSQASTAGHSIEAELQLLVVHGTLHLLGYDHASKEQKSIMWAAQAEILTQLGCTITAPTE